MISNGVPPHVVLPIAWAQPYMDNYVSLSPWEASWSRHSVRPFHMGPLILSASCLCWIFSNTGAYYYYFYNACRLLPSCPGNVFHAFGSETREHIITEYNSVVCCTHGCGRGRKLR